jgi:hypothetical protein
MPRAPNKFQRDTSAPLRGTHSGRNVTVTSGSDTPDPITDALADGLATLSLGSPGATTDDTFGFSTLSENDPNDNNNNDNTDKTDPNDNNDKTDNNENNKPVATMPLLTPPISSPRIVPLLPVAPPGVTLDPAVVSRQKPEKPNPEPVTVLNALIADRTFFECHSRFICILIALVPEPDELAHLHEEQHKLGKLIDKHRAASRDFQRVLFSGRLTRKAEDNMVAKIREHNRLVLELQDEKIELAQRASDLVAKQRRNAKKSAELIEQWNKKEGGR